MNSTVVIRKYRRGDELYFRDVIKDGIMAPLNNAFFGNVFKEITFQTMVLLAAVMFIYFGLSFTFCLLVIPAVILFTYICTYVVFAAKAREVDQEIANIYSIYMANAFSCFWVAELYEPYFKSNSTKDFLVIMTEKEFEASGMKVSSVSHKIVGTVGLLKSFQVDKGAWIKRLCVHRDYRHKGIASCLLKVAIDFAIDQGYSCVNTVSSEFTEGGRVLCQKKGFELKQMYHKPLFGTLIRVLMYELTYQIKPGENNYFSYSNPKDLNMK